MSLPLVLAGPIVRRVEAKLASVWVALSAPSTVQLDVWDGRVRAGASAPTFRGKPEAALRAGEHLYFHVAVVDLEETPSTLIAGRMYSYNLTFTSGPSGTQDLASLGLLTNRAAKEKDGVLEIKPHLALGYDQGFLPTFLLPPDDLTKLTLVHGSCRRPQVPTPDALPWVDDFIEQGIRGTPDARAPRPHQLLLTGDQVYSDDVAAQMLFMLGTRAAELMGVTEMLPARWASGGGQTGSRWKADLAHFPVAMRGNYVLEDARFTTADAENHLLSFGEFCAMHLFCWSLEPWPDRMPTVADMVKQPPGLPPDIWKLHTGLGDSTGKGFKTGCKETRELTEFSAGNLEAIRKCGCAKLSPGYHRQRRILLDFRNGLPKVRRALANVATYMMFDDHEVTDDWNISVTWVDRVFTSPSGGAILRNGMLGYMLCQGWGNDPRQFARDVTKPDGSKEPSKHKELLALVPKLLPAGAEGPVVELASKAEQLLGLTLDKPPNVVTWAYSVPAPKHLIVALDNRTRRGRSKRIAAPENLSEQSLNEQLPAGPLPLGAEVLIVVSSLTVLGPPVIDAILGPMSYKLVDLFSHGNKLEMPGLHPDAIESWPNNEIAFERLLDRLETYSQVVILSGDVHFAASAAMTYFKTGSARPARFAQFTSSGMRNLFPGAGRKASDYFAFLQRMIAAEVDVGRVAWKKKAEGLLKLPDGAKVSPRLRERLHAAPVLLPTERWPSGTAESGAPPPDWAWRVHVVRDTRADAQRPEGVQPAPLVPETPGTDVAADIDGYRRVASRHVRELDNINHDRQMVFASNLGVITFRQTNGVLTAVHELFAMHNPPFDQQPEPYTRHEVALTADPAETRPKIVGAPPDP